jgi:hypothetical protein
VVRINRKIKATICYLLVLVFTATHTPLALAQSTIDAQAPVVELVPMAEVEADDVQVFTVQAADDGILKDVILYYRRAGQLPYQQAPMKQIGSSQYYVANIETLPTDLRSFQYYIQARDESGNRTVDGYAFDPYTRTLVENSAYAAQALNLTSAPEVSEEASTATSSRIKWWHLALGVVAAGAIASTVGGDDGGQSDLAPITVNLSGL